MHTHQMTALTTPSFILIYLIFCSVYFKFLKNYSEKLEKQFKKKRFIWGGEEAGYLKIPILSSRSNLTYFSNFLFP